MVIELILLINFGIGYDIYIIKTMEMIDEKILNESIHKAIVKEANKSALKKKYIRHIYKALDKTKATSRFYSDESWEGKNYVCDVIANVEGVTNFECWVENGGYRRTNDGVRYKEYRILVEFGEISIEGTLTCHSAGTVEDPFARYDITVVLW